MNETKSRSSKELRLLLDSRLISPTLSRLYDVKLVDVGDYIQLYVYENKKMLKRKEKDNDLNLMKEISPKEKKAAIQNSLTQIEEKNIIRSKLECQRIAKANIQEWQTFITLTFAENITDVSTANKRFRYFIDKVRRVKKDFKYLCITEFQKRGAIHYHLLTNISIDDTTLIYTQEDNQKYKHIKYWLDGFTSIEVIKGDPKKIIGYIAKYMTKNIDSRLFSKHRYFYSRNLNTPIENYINFDNENELDFYNKKIQGKELVYQNKYINPYDNSKVLFLEFFKQK